MNYKNIYDNLISSRQILNRNKRDGNYYERHHILPRSLGGANDKINLVLLTAKKHFIAHLLLVKLYEGKEKRKMAWALWRMSTGKTNNNKNRIMSSSQYQSIRLLFIEILKKYKGEEHFMFGKKLSKETIKKRTASRIANGNDTPWNKGLKFPYIKRSVESIEKGKKTRLNNNNGF
ncbi:MAG: HNH endonuclease signature motif containing protein [Bacteroidia bacterium]